MTLSWVVKVRPDGSCVVPPGPSDGEIDPDDTEYPSVSAALDDLYDAVIAEYVNEGRPATTVRLVFEYEVAP